MDDEYEIRDLQEAENRRKKYVKKLHAHPDCRDPDHPGCPFCEDEEDENE